MGMGGGQGGGRDGRGKGGIRTNLPGASPLDRDWILLGSRGEDKDPGRSTPRIVTLP